MRLRVAHARPVPLPSLEGSRPQPAPRSLTPEEREKFERTVLPHMRAAYNLARWLLRRPQDAEDAVQEAYLRALRFFAGFRGGDGDGKAWLLTIVRNASYTAMQRGRTAQPTVSLDEEGGDVADEARGPEDLMLQEASRRALAEALSLLPVEFREAVVLRELEGLSYKEMGEVMQVPIGTVMSRLARAREKLRRSLQDRARGGRP